MIEYLIRSADGDFLNIDRDTVDAVFTRLSGTPCEGFGDFRYRMAGAHVVLSVEDAGLQVSFEDLPGGHHANTIVAELAQALNQSNPAGTYVLML